MSKPIAGDWLLEQADSQKDRKKIENLLTLREKVLKTNQFIGSNELFSLRLRGKEIWFHENSAFSSLEVYVEIFKENNHCLLPDFAESRCQLIVDVGANEGYYALKMKESNPGCQLICIEPNPYALETLKRNLLSNGVQNIIVISKAVFSSTTRIQLELIEQIKSIGGLGIKIAERPWLQDNWIKHFEAEAESLDFMLRDFLQTRIDILKIDVEGVEMEVLLGAEETLKRVDRIVVECHSDELKKKVTEFLQSKGRQCVWEENLGRYYGDLYFR